MPKKFKVAADDFNVLHLKANQALDNLIDSFSKSDNSGIREVVIGSRIECLLEMKDRISNAYDEAVQFLLGLYEECEN